MGTGPKLQDFLQTRYPQQSTPEIGIITYDVPQFLGDVWMVSRKY